MPYYINMKNTDGTRETIDEFDTAKERDEMLHEYRKAFTNENLYASSRPCANWKEKEKAA